MYSRQVQRNTRVGIIHTTNYHRRLPQFLPLERRIHPAEELGYRTLFQGIESALPSVLQDSRIPLLQLPFGLLFRFCADYEQSALELLLWFELLRICPLSLPTLHLEPAV